MRVCILCEQEMSEHVEEVASMECEAFVSGLGGKERCNTKNFICKGCEKVIKYEEQARVRWEEAKNGEQAS